MLSMYAQRDRRQAGGARHPLEGPQDGEPSHMRGSTPRAADAPACLDFKTMRSGAGSASRGRPQGLGVVRSRRGSGGLRRPARDSSGPPRRPRCLSVPAEWLGQMKRGRCAWWEGGTGDRQAQSLHVLVREASRATCGCLSLAAAACCSRRSVHGGDERQPPLRSAGGVSGREPFACSARASQRQHRACSAARQARKPSEVAAGRGRVLVTCVAKERAPLGA